MVTAHWNEWQGDSALGPRYSCVWHVVDCICRTSQEWKFKKLGCHVIWECHLKQLIPSDSSINTMLNITVLSKYLTWWKFLKRLCRLITSFSLCLFSHAVMCFCICAQERQNCASFPDQMLQYPFLIPVHWYWFLSLWCPVVTFHYFGMPLSSN